MYVYYGNGYLVSKTDEFGRVAARTEYNAWGGVKAYVDITVDQGYRMLLPEIT